MIRALALLFAALALPVAAAEPSLYALQAPLVDQAGRAITFDAARGHPVLVGMFYAECSSACPVLISRTRMLEKKLAPAARARLRVLLISMNPDHDTPAVLTELAATHKADLARWTFAAPQDKDVRKIAALLGIQYRQLPEGGFNHSVALTLLDGEGRTLARTERPGTDAAFDAALRAATQAP